MQGCRKWYVQIRIGESEGMKLYPDVHISDETLKSIKKLQEQLLAIGNATSDAVSGVLGRTAYFGRQNIVREEKNLFNFGTSYSKGDGAKRSRTEYTKEGYVIKGKTTNAGSPYRLVQYSFENAHSFRSRNAFAKSVKKAYISSKMLNLFEHNTKPYKADSPWINYTNGGFRISKGGIRQGKNFYTVEYKGVEKAIPYAIARTEDKLQREIDNATR